MCFPADHPGSLGMRYGSHPAIQTADVILIVDCDVPWIPTQCRPQKSARIFHIDIDPLKRLMPLAYVPALRRYTTDAYTSISQIASFIQSSSSLQTALSAPKYTDRWTTLIDQHQQRNHELNALSIPGTNNTFNASYLCRQLKKLLPERRGRHQQHPCLRSNPTNPSRTMDQLRRRRPWMKRRRSPGHQTRSRRSQPRSWRQQETHGCSNRGRRYFPLQRAIQRLLDLQPVSHSDPHGRAQ
ncbi:hypothetical protein BDV12DRAFT_176386 [Aspergillus spectabilis]